jgi:hypothetical protein
LSPCALDFIVFHCASWLDQIAIGSVDDQPLTIRYDPLMTSTSSSHFEDQFAMIGPLQHLTAIAVDSGKNGLVPRMLTRPLEAVHSVPVVNVIVLLLTWIVVLPFFLLLAAKSDKRQVETKTAKLSTLLASVGSTSGPIDLIKIDCEMAEWDCVQVEIIVCPFRLISLYCSHSIT